MIRQHDGQKMTARQAAKLELVEILWNNSEDCNSAIDTDAMTDRERTEYFHELHVQMDRIERFLGVEPKFKQTST